MSNNNSNAEKGCVAEVFIAFAKLGLSSFGGPVAHIGYFRQHFVERRYWLSESQFSQLLAICQFLPGPSSSQLGFAIGLLRAGWLGAMAAFVAFSLPSVVLLLAFAVLLPSLSGPLATSCIHGLKLVACAIVADAVIGMFNKLCSDTIRRAIALIVAITLLSMSTAWLQLLVVIGGAIVGVFLCRENNLTTTDLIKVNYSKRLGLVLFVIFLALLFSVSLLPNKTELPSIAAAFFHAGSLVFGGGHVVLPLLEGSIVATGWVSNGDFLAGYGAAQAVPGPMFSFAAYLGALIPTGHARGLVAATALIFMFLPGFLIVAALLPWWQAVSHNAIANKAIAGVNAAVVGILAATLYSPIATTAITSGYDLAIVVVAFVLLYRWKLSALWLVFWCLLASLLPQLINLYH